MNGRTVHELRASPQPVFSQGSRPLLRAGRRQTSRPPFIRMRRSFALVACLALLPAAAAPSVLPKPGSVESREGSLAIASGSAVGSTEDAGAKLAARRFASLVQSLHGVKLEPRPKSPQAPVRFEKVADGTLGAEGYRLEVTKGEAIVRAQGDAGLQHGASTLVQLASRMGDGLSIDAVSIADKPRFAWRGLMVDSARHYQSPEFLGRFIDWMALHKLNVLHWHLTDDQAWRLEIRKYPRLTQVGAWRVPAGAAREDIDPGTGKARRYGGFYSQATVRKLVRYAAERGITIVPEIDMPGHASAAMVAYPKLAAIDDPPRAVPADWGIYPNVYSLDESTFAFIEDVLREVMALFPGPYVHIGGDEVIRDQWLSARGRARMAQLGIDDPAKLQPYFTNRLGRFLAANGRRLVGWDEVLEPGLPADAVVMSWRGTKGAQQAAREGFDTVVAAHPTLYFDNRQSGREEEPPGRVATFGVDDVYAFDPMPAELSGDAGRHVLGVQGNLWTEHIRTEERLAVMAFPRAAAVAELGWAPPDSRDPRDFRGRLDKMMSSYDALGLGEAARMQRLRDEPAPTPDPLRRTSRQLKLCSENIALMLEDDAPPRGPRAVFTLDIGNPCWIFAGAPLDGVTAISARVGQLPFNFQIGEDVKKIHFAQPVSRDGELEVHLGTCEGEILARLPVAPATLSNAVTSLPAAAIKPRAGAHDLCLRFAQPRLEPLWALDRVELGGPR
jgi:hexosaminidase